MGPLPEIFSDKARIVCEYAAILWHKSFVDGNGGNVSMRVSSNTVLCTPTLFSKSRLKEKDIWGILRDTYLAEPFIRLVKSKKGVFRFPEPKILEGSNYCDVGFELDPAHNRLILFSALDNLMKGAAGAAMQCMNVIFDIPEKKGLEFPGLHPV